MREIKFRAWNEKHRKWIEPATIGIVADGIMFYADGIWKLNPEDGIQIMQFTGIKDKNGKEIYEGDIVISTLETTLGFTKVTYSMVEGKGISLARLIYAIENDLARGEKIQVIGNIYENPELLK
jgi:uncharacterized phage protein (TIGR01671 family)